MSRRLILRAPKSKNSEIKRDRGYWFVALQFWLLVAPVFLIGLAAASTMPAELTIAALRAGPKLAGWIEIFFLLLGLITAGLLIFHIWWRLKRSLAERDA